MSDKSSELKDKMVFDRLSEKEMKVTIKGDKGDNRKA